MFFFFFSNVTGRSVISNLTGRGFSGDNIFAFVMFSGIHMGGYNIRNARFLFCIVLQMLAYRI